MIRKSVAIVVYQFMLQCRMGHFIFCVMNFARNRSVGHSKKWLQRLHYLHHGPRSSFTRSGCVHAEHFVAWAHNFRWRSCPCFVYANGSPRIYGHKSPQFLEFGGIRLRVTDLDLSTALVSISGFPLGRSQPGSCAPGSRPPPHQSCLCLLHLYTRPSLYVRPSLVSHLPCPQTPPPEGVMVIVEVSLVVVIVVVVVAVLLSRILTNYSTGIIKNICSVFGSHAVFILKIAHLPYINYTNKALFILCIYPSL